MCVYMLWGIKKMCQNVDELDIYIYSDNKIVKTLAILFHKQ